MSQMRLDGSIDEGPEVPSLQERASWVVRHGDHEEYLELPRGEDTAYLTHGLFRYAGKLPPPLVAYLLLRHCPEGGIVVDTMCGGGTTLIEAVSSGHDAYGFDISPVSLVVSQAVSMPAEVSEIREFAARVLKTSPAKQPPADLEEYFSPEAYGLISNGLSSATSAAEKVLMLSIARPASFANTKKINTVVDKKKIPRDPHQLFSVAAEKFILAFEEFNQVATGSSTVSEGKATSTELPDEFADFVLLHPPYLTNTAFSEQTHLQLILLGCSPARLRQLELAYRGSYFHVKNGLKKYLLGWSKILGEASRLLKAGGRMAVVIGDGRIERVRIPVGVITEEFGKDLGLRIVERAEHLLNNQTGWTLSRRMSSQHVVVFEKSE